MWLGVGFLAIRRSCGWLTQSAAAVIVVVVVVVGGGGRRRRLSTIDGGTVR
jgi:hypothetical protein